jgi:torulene dioxygenase
MFGKLPSNYSVFHRLSMFFSSSVDFIHGKELQDVYSNVNVTISPAYSDSKTISALVAKTDANLLQLLDPDTLEPQKIFTYTDINPEFKGLLSSAHSQVDEITKTLYNFTIQPGLNATVTLFSLDEEHPNGQVLSRITLPVFPYIHSFAITQKYLVLVVFPAYFKYMGASILWYGNVVESLQWDEHSSCHYYVIDRIERKHVATFKSKGYFSFHHVNAFEHNDDVILDIVTYKDSSVINSLTMENLRNSTQNTAIPQSSYTRVTLKNIEDSYSSIRMAFNSEYLPIAEIETIVKDCGIELPRFNNTFLHMKPYRYSYGVASEPHSFANKIIKIDCKDKKIALKWQKPNHYPGEPLFILNSKYGTLDDPKDPLIEDDGVILSVVFDSNSGNSYLLVLNALDFTEISISKVPFAIPCGFHGNFIDSDGKLVTD